MSGLLRFSSYSRIRPRISFPLPLLLCRPALYAPFRRPFTAAATAPQPSNPTPVPVTIPPPSPSSIRGVLWFDNVYPMRAHFLDPRHFLATHEHEKLMPEIIRETEKAKDGGEETAAIHIDSMMPRMKEGGVFVFFSSSPCAAWRSSGDLANAVMATLIKNPRRALLTPKPVHVHLVKGEPFMDDILSRFPSARLRLELRGPAPLLSEITVENLYDELRSFGRIYDIAVQPYVKDQPRQVTVQFRSMHGAVGVRNCLHRLRLAVPGLGEATLFVNYDSVLKTSVITDFFVKHPRIMVPLLAALVLVLTILIFDPLRSFNIKNKITKRFNWQEITRSGLFAWLRRNWKAVRDSEYLGRLGFGGHKASKEIAGSWSARQQDEERVAKWLHSIPDRILFLTGPKGAGKLALVKKIVQDRSNVLYVDVSHFIDRSDDEFIKGLCQEIGFQPGFTLINAIWNMLDIFTPGASKAASTTQTGTQIQKMFEVTGQALEEIAGLKQQRRVTVGKNNEPVMIVSGPPAQADSQMQHEEIERFIAAEKGREESGNGNGSQGGIIIDDLPLFIIDGFTPDNREKHGNFLNQLVTWAGEQTFAGHARFLFLTDATLEESLSKQLPDVKMAEVLLNDASADSAFEFIAATLNKHVDELAEQEKKEIREAVSVIGGRYNDLITLIRQMDSGASPREAQEEIVTNSIAGAKSFLFGEEAKAAKWTRVQLWQTMTSLAASQSGALMYDDVLFNIFQGDDAALRGLIRADLMRIESFQSGGPDQLRAGSPVYLEAFRRMAKSSKLRPGLDLQVAKYYIGQEQGKINQYEDELVKLAAIDHGSAGQREAVDKRRQFLGTLIHDAHAKMTKYDAQRRDCEKKIKAQS